MHCMYADHKMWWTSLLLSRQIFTLVHETRAFTALQWLCGTSQYFNAGLGIQLLFFPEITQLATE